MNELNAEGFWDMMFREYVRRGLTPQDSADLADGCLEQWKKRWAPGE